MAAIHFTTIPCETNTVNRQTEELWVNVAVAMFFGTVD